MGIFSFGSKRAASEARNDSGTRTRGSRAGSGASGGRVRRSEIDTDREDRPASRASRARRTGVGQEAMLDPTLPEKQRARRRLVGAIALVLAAVIVLPMVLDATPKPVTGGIAIDIPRQEGAHAARSGDTAVANDTMPDNGADAVLQDTADGGNGTAASAASGLAGAPGAADAGNGKGAGAANVTGPAKANTTTNAAAPAKSAGATTPFAAAKGAAERFAETFDSKLSAAGSGKNAGGAGGAGATGSATTQKAALPPTPATPGARYVVQLGNFESTASAQEWVRKLKNIGVPAYVDNERAADGVTHSVLRAGPFADRATAQAAVQKVRGAGLAADGSTNGSAGR